MKRLVLLGAGVVAASVLAGCGSKNSSTAVSGAAGPPGPSDMNSARASASQPITTGPAGTPIVFAASSLQRVFPALGGSQAREAESDAGTTLPRASRASSSSDVPARATSGQGDAGLVYAGDAMAAGDQVRMVGFRQAARDVTAYPIAVLVGSRQPAPAHAFEMLVTGPSGQAALAAAGFGAAR